MMCLNLRSVEPLVSLAEPFFGTTTRLTDERFASSAPSAVSKNVLVTSLPDDGGYAVVCVPPRCDVLLPCPCPCRMPTIHRDLSASATRHIAVSARCPERVQAPVIDPLNSSGRAIKHVGASVADNVRENGVGLTDEGYILKRWTKGDREHTFID